MNPTAHPRISAVLVVGRQRSRAQHVLNQIGRQSCAGLEAIIIDLCPDQPPLNLPVGLELKHVREAFPGGLEEARARAVAFARAPYIAYLEDHCAPEPGWGEAIIRAFDSGRWAAVGYSFINANPESWVSRASMMADYALWAAPHPDIEMELLPGNNVAYRREILLGYGDRLPGLLSPDFVMHERLRTDGHRLFLAGSALASHQNPEELGFLLAANHAYCRLLAHHRAQGQEWGTGRRWLYTIGVPLGAPVIKLARNLSALARRPVLLPAYFAAMPVILIAFFWSAVGEALGYTFGPGLAKEEFEEYELNRSRV